MTIPLEPKKLFMAMLNDQGKEDFTRFMSQPLARSAAVYTMAHLAVSGMTKEQLEGARAAINTYMNLAEVDPIPAPYPVKQLATQ